MTGSDVRVTIEDVRELQTFNYFSNGLSLSPAGVAELGIPGLQAPAPPAALSGACRSDLLRIDGRAVPVRIVGSTQDATAMAPLTVDAVRSG